MIQEAVVQVQLNVVEGLGIVVAALAGEPALVLALGNDGVDDYYLRISESVYCSFLVG